MRARAGIGDVIAMLVVRGWNCRSAGFLDDNGYRVCLGSPNQACAQSKILEHSCESRTCRIGKDWSGFELLALPYGIGSVIHSVGIDTQQHNSSREFRPCLLNPLDLVFKGNVRCIQQLFAIQPSRLGKSPNHSDAHRINPEKTEISQLQKSLRLRMETQVPRNHQGRQFDLDNIPDQ